MAPVQRRLRAGWNRRSRIDARLWILGAVLVCLAAPLWIRIRGVTAGVHAAQLPVVGIRDCILCVLAAGSDRQSSPWHAGDHAGCRVRSWSGSFTRRHSRCSPGTPSERALAAASQATLPRLADGVRARPIRRVRGDRYLGLPAIAGAPTFRPGTARWAPSPRRSSSCCDATISEAIVLRPRERSSWIDVANHLRPHTSPPLSRCASVSSPCASSPSIASRSCRYRCHCRGAHDPPRLGASSGMTTKPPSS